jgi:AcrR family transcriptional regulator
MPRAGLDLPTLVAAAVELADQRGYAALTLRALAEKFGVAPPSLYNHVKSLEALQRELQLEGIRRLTERLARAAAGRAGADAMRALAQAWRDFSREHPGLYAATVRAPDAKDKEALAAAAKTLEIVNAVLSGFELSDTAAIHAARAIRSAMHGFVALEAAGGFGMPVERDESFRRLVEILIAGLPAVNGRRK